MKKIFLSMGLSALLLASLSAFADKMIITGQPVMVTKSGDAYKIPTTSTYTPTSDYYYVTVDNTRRVCYRDVQPGLSSVNSMDASLMIGTDKVPVHCYNYSADYFTVQ